MPIINEKKTFAIVIKQNLRIDFEFIGSIVSKCR